MVMDCPPHQERDAVFVSMYLDEKARAPFLPLALSLAPLLT